MQFRYRVFFLTIIFALCSLATALPNLYADSFSLPSHAYASLASDPDPTVNEYLKTLTPERIHKKTAQKIAAALKRRHFKKTLFNDELSEKVFNQYLSDLDDQRVYFLAEDIERFQTYRHRLDDTFLRGELQPAFDIFNLYQRRLVERMIYLIHRIDNALDQIDFSIDEKVEIDRKDAPWASNMDDLRDLWRKRLKNEVLRLKLTDKSVEEAGKLLAKRYRSQLLRVSQTTSEDAFRIYANAWAQVFDPHTQYFSPHLSENFKIQMRLSLEGIGALLQTAEEHTTVVRLVPAGPADKGKQLMAGDRIVGVGQGEDGEIVDVVGWRLDDVVQLIRGPKGTVVRLEILPAGMDQSYKTKIVSITRGTVKLEEQAAQKEILEIDYMGVNYRFGAITIPTFYIDFDAYHAGKPDYKSTTRDVHRLLEELIDERVDGVIIDLRDNGGGALQEASELTGLFIESGPTVQIKNADGDVSALIDRDDEITYSGPLVVMVNRMSASAAEIFAGAIQDYHRGIITGSVTYGKGTVQSLMDLGHGQFKLTFAKFYRVSGESTQHRGIVPDIIFPSIYDAEKLGESALKNALPWSSIEPYRFHLFNGIRKLLPQMRINHEQRISTSPDFAFLIESSQYRKKLRDQKNLPLNEEARRQLRKETEAKQLLMENTRRIAKGLKPLDKLENEEDGIASALHEDGKNDKDEEPDPILEENARILADMIRLKLSSNGQ